VEHDTSDGRHRGHERSADKPPSPACAPARFFDQRLELSDAPFKLTLVDLRLGRARGRDRQALPSVG
jgi:hypothetical protein